METTNMKINWKFPKNGWGAENGKNDPGMETFRGNPYPALAREPIQNSIDAWNDHSKPVRVEFSVFKLPQEKFPGREEYIKIVKQCIDEAKNGSETRGEMERALRTIKENEIYFMKISDFNTKGLSGSDKLRGSDWHRLIKVIGDSDKEETSGGAFGIGKHAPFVCSNLKVVFYNTMDLEGKKAFQGVAKLITFTGEDGEPHQATGFYGETDKIQPVKDMNLIDNIFVREETGTDLFVAGFEYRDTWEDEIIEAVISSFFVAIYENALEVKVGQHVINRASLNYYIEHLKNNGSKSNVINYYEVLTSISEPFIEKDFEGLGEVRLYVATNNTYNKKVAMVRKTGMVIKEKQNYQIPIKYAGILLIKGDAFNKELKRVENPTHTDWELKRKKDVKVIKSALKELNKWMNDKIKSLSPFEEVESFDVDELSQFLPDESDEMQFDSEQGTDEGERGQPLESKLVKINPKRKKKPFKVSDWEDKDDDDSTTIGKAKEIPVSTNPDLPYLGKPQPTPPRPRRPESKPSDEKVQRAKVSRYKLFCLNPEIGDLYRINLNVKKEGELSLRLEILGEDSDLPALISKAKISGQDQLLPIYDNVIGPVKVSAGNNRIEFQLTEKVRVAMGVTFNGK
ncbi:hypothetical protein [Bacillus subtilis]|uniref:hypothetical protein n=1 Tax=Bacillus subtilis TaxID=1423 RepID=UPI003A83D0E7